jgi:hypothetical protein
VSGVEERQALAAPRVVEAAEKIHVAQRTECASLGRLARSRESGSAALGLDGLSDPKILVHFQATASRSKRERAASLPYVVQGGRGGLDRRRARSRSNAGATGCASTPSPGISAGGSYGTPHTPRSVEAATIQGERPQGAPVPTRGSQYDRSRAWRTVGSRATKRVVGWSKTSRWKRRRWRSSGPR